MRITVLVALLAVFTFGLTNCNRCSKAPEQAQVEEMAPAADQAQPAPEQVPEQAPDQAQPTEQAPDQAQPAAPEQPAQGGN